MRQARDLGIENGIEVRTDCLVVESNICERSGESVSACEKIASIFAPHADIIIKGVLACNLVMARGVAARGA